MLRVVHIISGLDVGGAEMMLLKLLELPSEDIRHEVISLSDIGPIGDRIRLAGVTVEALGVRRGVPSLSGFFRLVRKLRSGRPDVVQTWMYHADLMGGVAARLAGVPTVIWNVQHSDLSPAHSKRMVRILARVNAWVSGRVPDGIISCSHTGQKVHVAHGYQEKKFIVIGNGTDLSRFRPNKSDGQSVRAELGLPQNAPLVGMLARFDPQKNHAGFLEAAGYVHQRLPEVHFLLAGKDVTAENETLEAGIRKHGLEEVCHLLGPRSDTPRLMAALDVYVSSSSFGEGFPNVLGEAMASAVPCVVTDVGDSVSIVGDTGRAVALNDMRGLAERTHEILALPEAERKELGDAARRRIAEHFEIGQVVNAYHDFYRKVAGRRTV